MPRIKTDLLKEGLVVATGVKNIDGMLLIPAGASLTERHINILQAWGVTDIDIETNEDAEETVDPLAKLPPEVLARLTEEVKALFWQMDESSPVAMEIRKLMLQRRALKHLAES